MMNCTYYDPNGFSKLPGSELTGKSQIQVKFAFSGIRAPSFRPLKDTLLQRLPSHEFTLMPLS